jgi:hypothetical protein
MGRFSRDYLRVAKEQGMPQGLICLPAKPPQDEMTSKKGEDKNNNNKETEIYRSDSEVEGKENDKVNKEHNENTSVDDDSEVSGKENDKVAQNEETMKRHPWMRIPLKRIQTIINYILRHHRKDVKLKPKQQPHKRSKLKM